MLQVHLRSHFIMNGVCVRWRGWVDLERLEGIGCLEFDDKAAAIEDAMLRDQIERYNQRLRDFDEKQRAYRQQQERLGANLDHVRDQMRDAELDVRHGHGGHAQRHVSHAHAHAAAAPGGPHPLGGPHLPMQYRA